MRLPFHYCVIVICGFLSVPGPIWSEQPVGPPRQLSKSDDEWVKKKYAEALAFGREGKWGYDEAQRPVREIVGRCEHVLGKDHYVTAYYSREIELLKTLGDLPEAGRIEYRKTYVLQDTLEEFQKKGRYDLARLPAEQILDIYRRLLGPESFSVAAAAHQCGQILYHGEHYPEAEKHLREALRVYQGIVGDNYPAVAEATGYVALGLEKMGRYAEARPMYEKALRLNIQVWGESHAWTAVARNNLAGYLDRQAYLNEAEELHREAVKALQAMGSQGESLLATSYNNLALNLQHQGKYDEAEKLFQNALSIRRRLKQEDQPETGRVYLNLASNREAQGNIASAELMYRKALDNYLKGYGSNSSETAWAMNSLAVNLDKQGKYTEAESRLREALEILRRAPGAQGRAIAKISSNLASCLGCQNKHAEAVVLCEEALTILRKQLEADHPDIAAALNNLASNLVNQDRYADAEGYFRDALAIMEKRPGKNHPDTALGRVNLAVDLYHQGKYDAAEPYLEAALDTMRQVLGEGHPNTAWAYKNLIGNACARGDYAKALAFANAATASFEAARLRLGFAGLDRARRADDVSPMEGLIVAAARLGKPEAAWQALESNLARGLLDDLTASRLSDADRQRVLVLVEKIDSLNRRMKVEPAGGTKARSTADARERDAEQAELARILADPAAKYGVAGGQVYDLHRIQKQLADDAALVAWVDRPLSPGLADPRGDHWACVVRHRGAPIWVRLPGTGPAGAWTDEDDRQGPRSRRVFAQRPTDMNSPWKEYADKLVRQRLMPLEDSLKAIDGQPGVRHLVVLPSFKMAAVPLEALTDRFTISYAPSGTAFAWLKEQRAKQAAPAASLLALGDPTFQLPHDRGSLAQAKAPSSGESREAFDRLPGSRQELMGVARVFSETRLLMGDQASTKNLNELAAGGGLSHFRYLHFATHGVLDDQRPLNSALILAQDQTATGQNSPEPNGRLTAEGILRGWKLNADLVTLSACNTGLGKLSGGEGYLGFSQALFLAGARSLVVGLWQVDDSATALLMTRFYENLLGTPEGTVKPMPKADALAEAKRWLRELKPEEVRDLTKDLPTRGTRGRIEKRRATGDANAVRSFEHPYYWSGFVLIGEAG